MYDPTGHQPGAVPSRVLTALRGETKRLDAPSEAALVRFVDRSPRRSADAALSEAAALMQALTELRLGPCNSDTAANAAHLARETRAIVTRLQIACGRLDARVEGR